jgi:hypothetical protein
MICEVCGVDHDLGMADLSHGIICLLHHARERIDWLEFPCNGDMIARQRAGIVGPALVFTTADPEEIDWEVVAESAREDQHQRDG